MRQELAAEIAALQAVPGVAAAKTARKRYQHSRQKWHETKSLPWLVSAVAHASAEDGALNELLSAASRVTPEFIRENAVLV